MPKSGMWQVAAVLVIAGSVAACSVDTQEAPPLAGPSTFAQSLTLSASPDRLQHRDTAQSVITLTMRNENGQPISGQRVSVAASTGFISHVDVVTGTDGRAIFNVTAPATTTPASEIKVFATPFGTDADNAQTRTLTIALLGPRNTTLPTPAFTFLPETPVAGDTMVFDASTTTDEGQPCLDLCRYKWSFGGLGAGVTDGMVVTRNQTFADSFVVTLTVTDDVGSVSSTQRVVTIAPSTP